MSLYINGHKIYDIKNCMGMSNDSKPCPYMNECDLKDWYSDINTKEIVCRIGDLKNPMECKRDNHDINGDAKEDDSGNNAITSVIEWIEKNKKVRIFRRKRKKLSEKNTK